MGLSSIFQDIADAIRSKTGKSESIYPVNMASEIEGISSGGGYKLEKMPSGAISFFNDGTDLPLNKLKVSIEHVEQDLHGYDAPWAGGARKNKCEISDDTLKKPSWYGGTWEGTTKAGEGAITVTRGSAQGGMGGVVIPNYKDETTYTLSFDIQTSGSCYYIYTLDGTTYQQAIIGNYFEGGHITRTFAIPQGAQGLAIKIAPTAAPATITNMQLEEGSTATSYAPYSNICPISGRTRVNVTVANDVESPTISNVYTIDLDGTRYGGTLEVVSGALTVTNANIASYNGETINDPWVSSMDVYSAGATPTTGAQVVYPLATPQTIQLTPTAVRSLIELNNIWADTGDIINGEYFKKED